MDKAGSFRKLIRTLRLQQERLMAEQKPRAFEGRHGRVVIHLDTYPERLGKWRVTWLRDGDAAAHSCAADYLDAIKLAREYGAHLDRELPAALEAIEVPA